MANKYGTTSSGRSLKGTPVGRLNAKRAEAAEAEAKKARANITPSSTSSTSSSTYGTFRTPDGGAIALGRGTGNIGRAVPGNISSPPRVSKSISSSGAASPKPSTATSKPASPPSSAGATSPGFKPAAPSQLGKLAGAAAIGGLMARRFSGGKRTPSAATPQGRLAKQRAIIENRGGKYDLPPSKGGKIGSTQNAPSGKQFTVPPGSKGGTPAPTSKGGKIANPTVAVPKAPKVNVGKGGKIVPIPPSTPEHANVKPTPMPYKKEGTAPPQRTTPNPAPKPAPKAPTAKGGKLDGVGKTGSTAPAPKDVTKAPSAPTSKPADPPAAAKGGKVAPKSVTPDKAGEIANRAKMLKEIESLKKSNAQLKGGKIGTPAESAPATSASSAKGGKVVTSTATDATVAKPAEAPPKPSRPPGTTTVTRKKGKGGVLKDNVQKAPTEVTEPKAQTRHKHDPAKRAANLDAENKAIDLEAKQAKAAKNPEVGRTRRRLAKEAAGQAPSFKDIEKVPTTTPKGTPAAKVDKPLPAKPSELRSISEYQSQIGQKASAAERLARKTQIEKAMKKIGATIVDPKTGEPKKIAGSTAARRLSRAAKTGKPGMGTTMVPPSSILDDLMMSAPSTFKNAVAKGGKILGKAASSKALGPVGVGIGAYLDRGLTLSQRRQKQLESMGSRTLHRQTGGAKKAFRSLIFDASPGRKS